MLYKEIDKLIMGAMKERNVDLLNVLKLIKSELVKAEKDGTVIDDASEARILMKMARQREDSIRQYIDGCRSDLADSEQKELDVIKSYIPAEPSDEEIENYSYHKRFITWRTSRHCGKICA